MWDSELQGFGKKLKFRGVFKTYRKIRCFLERTQFLTFVGLPVGSSTVFKRHTQKRWCFGHFCNFPVDSSQKTDSLEWELQCFRPAKMAKMAKMLDQKVWELSTELQLNGVLKRRKRGSSQLRGVSNAWNSVFCCFETWELSTRMAPKLPIRQRLHRKVNAGINANHRNPRFGGCPATWAPRDYV